MGDYLLKQQIDTLFLDENLGFAGNVNAGLKHIGPEEDILLCNDDVVFLTPGWDEALQRHRGEGVAGVGPVSNYVLGHQLVTAPGNPVDRTNRLSFFCCLLFREALWDVGPLDEDFGIGLSEDLDWWIRAEKNGWHGIIDRSVFVQHWGSQTLRTVCNYPEQDAKNRRLLAQKHPEHARLSE